MDETTFKGPFQSKPFYDSMIVYGQSCCPLLSCPRSTQPSSYLGLLSRIGKMEGDVAVYSTANVCCYPAGMPGSRSSCKG